MREIYCIEHLTKIYKKSNAKANDDLTFTIYEGEIFGLLGPNGAGKSTLVNQISGLLHPTSGSIRLFDKDIIQHPHLISYYIALQPQHSLALKDLYPQEAILYTARFRGLSSQIAQRQTNELMEELGLHALRKKRIGTLSGGQKKLVTLAVAFVGNSRVQIFDEPTNELDPDNRRIIWDKLLSLQKQGVTIILVTHNVLEAERVIQRVGIINHGQLMALGTCGELKARVDQRVKLELLLKDDTEDYRSLFETLGEVRALTRLHWTVLCYRDVVRGAIDQVLERVGLDQMDDFRILTPSLEDVYLQLGGGTKLG